MLRCKKAGMIIGCLWGVGCSQQVQAISANVADAMVGAAQGGDGRDVVLAMSDVVSVQCANDVLVSCEGNCVDLRASIEHCGACGHRCASVVHGSAACESGECRVLCAPGFRWNGSDCLRNQGFTRPVSPLSLSDVTTVQPTLRWVLGESADGADVQVCADRECARILQRMLVSGTSVRLNPLGFAQTVFWRMRETVGAFARGEFGPVWLFHTPHQTVSTDVDSSGHPHLDCNGDGFDDVVVYGGLFGRPQAPNRARFTVLFGSPQGLSVDTTQVIEGPEALGGFASTMANAGDVNGDGFADLLVTSGFQGNGAEGCDGKALVYYGSRMGFAQNNFRVVREGLCYGRSEVSVATAGDSNGDGYADVLVGAPLDSYLPLGGALRLRAGSVRLFLGSAEGIDPRIAREFWGPANDSNLGVSLVGGFDGNGDGLSDFAAGCFRAGVQGVRDVGQVQVYYAGAMGIGTQPSSVLEGTVDLRGFGGSLTAGDLNNDGFAELAVGHHAVDGLVGSGRGRVSVFQGQRTGYANAANVLLFHSANANGGGPLFGGALRYARDLDGDGFGDLAVSALLADYGQVPSGDVSIFRGSAHGVVREAQIELRAQEGTGLRWAWSLGAVGDIDGDGFAELAVGTPFASEELLRGYGLLALFRGTAMGLRAESEQRFRGSNERMGFARAIAE